MKCAGGTTVRFNTIVDSPGGRIDFRNGYGGKMIANWIENAGGIAIFGGGHEIAGNVLAGASRPQLYLGAGDVAPAGNNVNLETLRAFGAAMRANQIAGALSRALEITLQYANERVQFGKPIAKFQAIQHNLAMLAAHSAAANAAADMAAEAAANGMKLLPIAAAKARCGEAASIGAGIAHQTHGAIGFTREHMLHYFTKRLWSWRDEFGKESDWSLVIGRAAAKAGPTRIWSDIVTA